MAASGLTNNTCDTTGHQHVFAMIEYALELFQKITNVNEHSFNNFRMRIGINIGSVVAGVIGSRKPQYGKYLSLFIHVLELMSVLVPYIYELCF